MEVWKDIYFTYKEVLYDYTGLYQVSNLGKVKSLNYNHTRREKELKIFITKDGYRRVTLYDKNGKSKQFCIHRLVAHMFISNIENKLFVDHIIPVSNGGTDCVENLRWVTVKENNNNELTRKNLSKKLSGENNPMYGKTNSKNPNYGNGIKIVQYDKNMNYIQSWDNANQASKSLNICVSNIKKCCKFWNMNCDKTKWFERYTENPPKTAGGFIWKYYKEEGENSEDTINRPK